MNENKKNGQSKLFNLKKWLTVPEAARHLSSLFDEAVSEADVLRLVLDRHLKLSVYFVNHTYARRGGKFFPFEEWKENFKEESVIDDLRSFVGHDGKLILYIQGHDISFPTDYPTIEDIELNPKSKGVTAWIGRPEELGISYWRKLSSEAQSGILRYMAECIIASAKAHSEEFGMVPPSTDSFTGDVKSIDGVWDLPMLGAERLDIEHKYQQLTGGPEVTLQTLDGAFVEGEHHTIWQLQESFDDNEYQSGSSAQFEKIKRFIAENDIDESRAKKLLEEHEKKRKDYLENRSSKERSQDYYPAGALPSDSVLVVRTSSLREFEDRYFADQEGDERPPSKRQQSSDLHIIGALLEVIVEGQLFSSEEKLRDHIADQYRGYSGCASRTLAGRFAEAKKLLRLVD